MKEEILLNPNCSEITMRIKVDKFSEKERKELVKELDNLKVVREDGSEYCMRDGTSVFENTVFGIPIITVDGEFPYYHPKMIEELLEKKKIKEFEYDE